MLKKNIYAIFTAMSILNIVVVPITSIFPFQWALLLAALLVNRFTKISSIRCISIFIILLSCTSIVVMDILGCLFLSHNVYLCFLLVFFSIFPIVNVVISVRLLIGVLVEFANKQGYSFNRQLIVCQYHRCFVTLQRTPDVPITG